MELQRFYEEEISFRVHDFGFRLEHECVVDNVISVGYIPGFDLVEAKFVFPRGFRKWRWRAAFWLLAKFGNPIPASTLSMGDGSLNALAESKDFRCILWIRRLHLAPVPNGGVEVRFVLGSRAGYTPFLGHFMQGLGSTVFDYKSTSSELVIGVFSRFKVGKIADIGSLFLSQRWAPSAWMQMELRIGCLGNYEVLFHGSMIPSQQHYHGSVKRFCHDMWSARPEDVEGFMFAGACQDAPSGASVYVLPVEALESLGG